MNDESLLAFEEALDELESAEDFLNYFEVAFEDAVVRVNRLHILQRFHDYLAAAEPLPGAVPGRRRQYRELLQRAYDDFVASTAQREKVFEVFRQQDIRQGFVPIEELLGKP